LSGGKKLPGKYVPLDEFGSCGGFFESLIYKGSPKIEEMINEQKSISAVLQSAKGRKF
jgi:hypothetical protein